MFEISVGKMFFILIVISLYFVLIEELRLKILYFISMYVNKYI